MTDAPAPFKLRLTDVVDVVLTERPATAEVFHRLRMACPGCAMASFMTLGEAAASYDLDPDMLIRELEAAG